MVLDPVAPAARLGGNITVEVPGISDTSSHSSTARTCATGPRDVTGAEEFPRNVGSGTITSREICYRSVIMVHVLKIMFTLFNPSDVQPPY